MRQGCGMFAGTQRAECPEEASARAPEGAGFMLQESSSSSPDVEFFAFSEHGPWTPDPAQITWLPGLTALRAQTQAELPQLLRRRIIPPLGRFLETAYRL